MSWNHQSCVKWWLRDVSATAGTSVSRLRIPRPEHCKSAAPAAPTITSTLADRTTLDLHGDNIGKLYTFLLIPLQCRASAPRMRRSRGGCLGGTTRRRGAQKMALRPQDPRYPPCLLFSNTSTTAHRTVPRTRSSTRSTGTTTTTYRDERVSSLISRMGASSP